jgi:polyisoprenoid-binding protein YceI
MEAGKTVTRTNIRWFRPMRRAWAVFFLMPLLAAPACTQEISLELDPSRTQVEFTLDAFMHTVHGTMKLTQGRIQFDPATGEAGGLIVIDARSANTDNDGRDKRMHKEILESATYPEISFSPHQVQGQVQAQGQSKVQMRGMVNLHSRQQEIVIPVKVQFTGDEWFGEATFPVPYVKWGLTNPSNLFLRVKDTVILNIRAAGRVSGGRP